jgi:very-short-patch-repair endonuclease
MVIGLMFVAAAGNVMKRADGRKKLLWNWTYALDFALIRPNGRKLNIEVDGEHYHRDWNGELLRHDQLRNLRMIELGWDVMRFWVYQVRDDLPECMQRVAQWVAKADAAASVVSRSGAASPDS